jgi:DNA primase
MIYDLVKNRVQISDVIRTKVELKQRGSDYIGLCPFHPEKTPSFSVNNFKKFFYCFGCHAGGDVISFISQLTGLSYRDAAFKLAQDYRIEIPSSAALKQELDEFDKMHSVLELALEFYQRNLGADAIKYLNNRGISQSIIEKFQIGYAPGHGALRKYLEEKNVPLFMMDKAGLVAKKDSSIYEVFRERVIFPIRNNHNKLIAFGGRVLKDVQPKYLNSPETLLFKKSECFYGENLSYTSCYKNNRAILVEGYIDLIKMHGSGFTETLATLGTAVSEKHLDRLWVNVDEIILCLDGDDAGLRASKRVVELALPKLKSNKHISFVMLPSGFDPDEFLKNKGKAQMESLIQNRLELSKMLWLIESSDGNFSSAESIAKLESKLSAHVQIITDSLVAKSYKRFFNDQIWALSRSKKTSTKVFQEYSSKADSVNEDMLEITLIALLIMCRDLLDDQDVSQKIKEVEFSSKYADFINSKQIGILEADILPKIHKANPGFSLSLTKTNPKQVFLKMAKQYSLLALKKTYTTLSENDPKKFLENFKSYKIEVDKLLGDDE